MIPGNARILTCPHCDGEKEVLSLVSGNTFGASLWSDTKRIAPMLPQVFPIQKCPSCGHYYLLSRQGDREKYGKSWSLEEGALSFDEMKDVLLEAEDWQLTTEEERTIRIQVVWTYNDKYYREKNKTGTKNIQYLRKRIKSAVRTLGDKCKITPALKDEAFFKQNVLKLIPLVENELFKAELYREISRFEDAIKILKTIEPTDEFMKKLIEDMLLRCEQGDSKVWQLC